MKLFFFYLNLFSIPLCLAQNNIKVSNDTTFADVTSKTNRFVLKMKYATTDNFLKIKVYDCDQCYLRTKTIEHLLKADSIFAIKQYKIVLYDCYRPFDVQLKMWDIMPNPDYVADPKKGSFHNKGCAVDIGLVDKKGNLVAMGTDFDFFGIEASHSYKNLSKKVLKNREYLRKTMISCGFKPLETEWWHYTLVDSNNDKISNFKWNCD